MKRKIGLFALALALTGTLVACGNKNASVDPSAPAVAPTDSAEPSNTMTPRTNNSIVGKADNAMRNAGNAARNAMDNMGDAARGAMEGLEDTAPGYGSGYNWNGAVPGAAGYGSYDWSTNGMNYDDYGYAE